MILTDSLAFAIPLVLGIFFTVEATDFPLSTLGGKDVMWGEITAHVKAIGYPLLAAICWYVMAALMDASNNCSGAFQGTCFTSPTYATTTATISANPIGGTLYLLFLGLFFVFVVWFFAAALYLTFKPMIKEPVSAPPI